jgi:hypothetical protein
MQRLINNYEGNFAENGNKKSEIFYKKKSFNNREYYEGKNRRKIQKESNDSSFPSSDVNRAPKKLVLEFINQTGLQIQLMTEKSLFTSLSCQNTFAKSAIYISIKNHSEYS